MSCGHGDTTGHCYACYQMEASAWRDKPVERKVTPGDVWGIVMKRNLHLPYNAEMWTISYNDLMRALFEPQEAKPTAVDSEKDRTPKPII